MIGYTRRIFTAFVFGLFFWFLLNTLWFVLVDSFDSFREFNNQSAGNYLIYFLGTAIISWQLGTKVYFARVSNDNALRG
jgi:hypothetical protein